MVDATKQCRGCTARLLASDPDLCELCDLHRHDHPAGDVTEGLRR